MRKVRALVVALLAFSLMLVGCENTHAHNYSKEWKFDAENHWQECIECGEKTNVTKHEYSWKFDDETHRKECTCGSKTEPVTHKLDNSEVIKEATEDAEGEIKYTCECGKTKTEIVNKLPHTHNFSTELKYDTENHWEECTKCGEKTNVTKHEYSWKFDEETHWKECACGSKTEPVTHKFDNSEVIKEATEDEEGEIKYTCECGKTKTEIVDKLPHTHVYGDLIAEVLPTCEKAGSVSHYHCDKCGKNFNEQKEEINDLEIAALGHELKMEIAEQSTTETEGTVAYTCTREGCTYVKTVKLLKLPNITFSGNAVMWNEVDSATGYKAIVGGEEIELGSERRFVVPTSAIAEGIKIAAYTTNEQYYGQSETEVRFSVSEENLQKDYNCDFEKSVLPITVPSKTEFKVAYPYGNWSTMDYQIIAEADGNVCAKLQPTAWYPKSVILKKDCSVDVVKPGTYVLAIDVKLGPNQHIPEGKIVIALVYKGGSKTIANVAKNIASCTQDGWTTISYEYTVAEGEINSTYAQIDFTYWPEKDLTDNYVLMDNIRIYAKDDAEQKNIDKKGGGDFEIFSEKEFKSNKWYVGNTILIEKSAIGSGIVEEEGNKVFKAYTNGVACEFDLKGNLAIANGGLYKMTMKIKLGAGNTKFDSLGMTAWVWTTDDSNAHQIVRNTSFGGLNLVNKDDYVTLEMYFSADNLPNCRAINLFFWVGLNNTEQLADNFALIDDVTIQQVTMA